MSKKIAIIGAGMAGLTCGYLLNQRHRIKVFEKSSRVGGNAFMFHTPDGHDADIAVAAFGKAGYGEFYALLAELGIDTEACSNTFMSFHNMESGEGLYLTPSLKGSIRQWFDLFKPKTIKTLLDMFLGIRKAIKLRDQGKLVGLTMRDLVKIVPELHDEGLLLFFGTLCLMSSMECYEVLDTPAEFFVSKLKHHNDVISPKFLFSVRAITGGTQTYIKKLAETFRENIALNSKISKVIRSDQGVKLIMADGSAEDFDEVVFACNADQALDLLERPTEEEKAILGVWRYKEGRIVVHRDHSHFPSKDLIQAYTYLYNSSDRDIMSTSVNGALWFEPYVGEDCDFISSQHPNFPIRADLVAFDGKFRTPLFSFESVASQKDLPSLNGVLHSYYCGSHFGYGLHNDAVSSAYAVAKAFGVVGPSLSAGLIETGLRDIFKKAPKVLDFFSMVRQSSGK